VARADNLATGHRREAGGFSVQFGV